jgi:hypothetical protein
VIWSQFLGNTRQRERGGADEIAEAEDMALMLFRGGMGALQSFSLKAQRTQKLKTAFAACKFELRV